MAKEFFTSESVTEGHPDKLCDQISDAILDAILKQDPKGRVAVETIVTNGLVFIAGEITTSCYIEIPNIARQVIKETGYTNPEYGFSYQNCGIITSIQEQSPDIARGVKKSKNDNLEKIGAGDQGIMFGYASKETKELMPLPIMLAHKLTIRLAEARKTSEIPYLRPDGKAQVTIEYREGLPKRVENIVISAQHNPDVVLSQLRKDIQEKIIKKIIPVDLLDNKTSYFINPTGRFVIGGPQADTGLTGRKIIVDTYGGVGSHGGGAFSGKDPTKVDRSASYAMRYIAKNIVAAGLADKVETRVAYAIGVAKPLGVTINTYGTGKLSDDKLAEAVKKIFDLRPGMIIKNLELQKPIYRQIAAYGHFGRDDLKMPWEKVDKIKDLQKLLNH